jgi:hypothetical protein
MQPRFDRALSFRHKVVGVKSPSLTMSALSSILCAHDRMHSEKSAISLYQLVLRFPTWLALNR